MIPIITVSIPYRTVQQERITEKHKSFTSYRVRRMYSYEVFTTFLGGTAFNMQSIECLLFDLDGTLYDISNGYMQRIRENLFRLMVEKGFASTVEDAESIWRPLFKTHNQSFKGLREGGYLIDQDEHWEKHRDGMEEFFAADDALRKLLLELPHRKIIFTNCREKEAIQIMKLMNIHDCFDKVYGADFMGDICKPQKESFEMVLADMDTAPQHILYFEDSVKNLRTAEQLGLQCVLISSETANEEGANIVASDPSNPYLCKISGFDNNIMVLNTLNDGEKQLRSALPALFVNPCL